MPVQAKKSLSNVTARITFERHMKKIFVFHCVEFDVFTTLGILYWSKFYQVEFFAKFESLRVVRENWHREITINKSFAISCPAKFLIQSIVNICTHYNITAKLLNLQKCVPILYLFTGIPNNSYQKMCTNWTKKYPEKAQ